MTPFMKSKQVPRGTPLYGPYGEAPPKRDTQASGKGGFPLSRNFYVLTHVIFTRVNKIGTMYGRSRVNVKVEPRSTFTFPRRLSYIASISFTRLLLRAFVRKNYATVEINPKKDKKERTDAFYKIM